jgi:2-polyprenyl-3-methyl-5-hydroxy-6-metoxy-1,4-benzoquinol methylase
MQQTTENLERLAEGCHEQHPYEERNPEEERNLKGTVMKRVRVKEFMDDPELPPKEHHRALLGLERLNALTGVARPIWQAIASFVNGRGNQQPSILDIGSGAGDLIESCQRRAKKAGMTPIWTASDYNPRTVELLAKRFAQKQITASARCLDVCAQEPWGEYDLVLCNLFLHHFDPPQVVAIFRSMKASAKRGVIVGDLSRSRLNWFLVWLGCHAVSRSYVVIHDGLASVEAAYTPSEIRDLAEEAGLQGARVQNCFPCRWILRWERPAS